MQNNYYINDDGNKIYYNIQMEYGYNLKVTSRNYEKDVFNGIKDFYEKKYDKTFMDFASFSSLIINNSLESDNTYGLRLTKKNIIIYNIKYAPSPAGYGSISIYVFNIENKIVQKRINRNFYLSQSVYILNNYISNSELLPCLYINDEETYMAISAYIRGYATLLSGHSGSYVYINKYYTGTVYDVYDLENDFNNIYYKPFSYENTYLKNKTNYVCLSSDKLIFQDDEITNKFHIIELKNNNNETIFSAPTYINRNIYNIDCTDNKFGFLVDCSDSTNNGSYMIYDISNLTNIVLYKQIFRVRDNVLFKVFRNFYNSGYSTNLLYMNFIPIYLDSDGITIGSLFNFYSLKHYIVDNSTGWGPYISTHFFPGTLKIDMDSKIIFYDYTNIFNTYYSSQYESFSYNDPYTNVMTTIQQDFNNLYILENVSTFDNSSSRYTRFFSYYYGGVDSSFYEIENISENKYLGVNTLRYSQGSEYIGLVNNAPTNIQIPSSYSEEIKFNVKILKEDYVKPPIATINKTLRVIPVNDVPVIKIDDEKVDSTNKIYLLEDTTETFKLYIYDEENTNINDFTIYVDDNLSSPVLYVVDKDEKTLDITTPLNFYGTFIMNIKCSDKTGTNSTTIYYNISVSNVNDAPTVNDRDFVGYEDNVITGTFTSNDIEGSVITYTIIEEPTNGTVEITSGNSFAYTPKENFNGVDTFKYKGNDGEIDSLNVGIVTITVRPVNDTPLFDKETPMSSYISTEGQQVIVTAPYYSDIDNDISELRLKAFGNGVASYVDNLDGTITITCNRTVGIFDIDLKVYDIDGLYDTVTFKLKIDRNWGSNCTLVKDTVNPRRLFLEKSNSYDFSILNLTKDDINTLIDDETELTNLYNTKLNDIKYPHPHNYLLITDYVNKDGSILNYTKNKVIDTKVITDYLTENDFSLIVQKFTPTKIEFTTDYIFDFTQGEEQFNTCSYDELGVTRFIFEDIEYYQINYIKYTINNKEVIFNNKTIFDYNRDYTLYYKNNYGVYYYNEEKKKVFFNRYF